MPLNFQLLENVTCGVNNIQIMYTDVSFMQSLYFLRIYEIIYKELLNEVAFFFPTFSLVWGGEDPSKEN